MPSKSNPLLNAPWRKLSVKGRIIAATIVIFILIWLLLTDHPMIWPVRNTIQYHLYTWWWGLVDEPQPLDEPAGRLAGTVYNSRQEPIADAWVLVSRWDGTSYKDQSDANGSYQIDGIPPGRYRPVADAPGYEPVQFGNLFDQVNIRSETTTTADATLPVEQPRAVAPGRDLQFGEPTRQTCTLPLESEATQQQIYFQSGDGPNEPTFYYTPITATASSQLPILLAIYPGPAESWKCASIPLAEAGYAVLAAGPAYNFDLEADIDEMERLLSFSQAGAFPEGNGEQIGLVGGSYSSLHVLRLLQRGVKVKAALLLGPPTDLFEMRRRLEDGTFIPPFDLDRALRALGFPDRKPIRYWRYSGAYHVRPDYPPLMILHSYTDEVVPFQQSEILAANLAQVGATFETHFFGGSSHYLLSEDGGADMLYRISLDFLGKYLP